jgi:large subunit ribosomal protein L18e
MVKRTGPTNPMLKKLIEELKKKSLEENVKIWKRVAELLERPTRKRVEINLKHIEREARDGETIIVPGVVLSEGELTKKVTIAAWRFSAKTKEKIEKVGARAISIEELIKENPKGSNVRIMV